MIISKEIFKGFDLGDLQFSDCNNPGEVFNLETNKLIKLLCWIEKNIVSANSRNSSTSYGLKHMFECEGFYITNGMFKGAMLLRGFDPIYLDDTNWSFKIKLTNECKKRLINNHGYVL